ncbi:MAG TPA: VWA domain-containing protein [Acidimicrobiales bacterium]|jgi:Ca-activated chloride channel family protein|nr:VWA domain-containing protein [Acidimicrobiales bacterium]
MILALTFLSRSRLWFLLVVAALIAAYVVMQLRRKEYAVRFTNLNLLDSIAPKRPTWRRHVPAAAFVLAMIALVTAFAQPARPVKVPRERATVVMAIDVSLSMEATDVSPNRLVAAQEAAKSFVDIVPSRLNVGLVAFSGTAQVLVSPTTDHALLKRGIDTLQLGPRTAIGEAVFASLAAIQSVPTEPGQAPAPGRIVLMSDGETTVGRDNAAATKAASDAKVQVSTIAFGTDDGTVEVEGRSIPVPVNREALAQIADGTGGKAFEATTAKELRRVYDNIGSSIGYRTEQREITSWLVGIALAFALAAAAGSLLWTSRLP